MEHHSLIAAEGILGEHLKVAHLHLPPGAGLERGPHVEEALREIVGVVFARVDQANGRVTIEHDGNVSLGTLVRTMIAAGHAPEIAL